MNIVTNEQHSFMEGQTAVQCLTVLLSNLVCDLGITEECFVPCTVLFYLIEHNQFKIQT